MAIALVSHGKGVTTTSAINTTGADFLVVCVGNYSASGDGTPTDNKSNSWSSLTAIEGPGSTRCRLHYSIPSSVGASHTFTAGGSYAGICVAAFSGVKQTSPFDVQNGGTGTGGVACGSITTAEDNELVIAGFTADNAPISDLAINSGLTLLQHQVYSGSNFAAAIAYIVKSAAGAINPAWTGTIGNCAGADAAFKQASGAAIPVGKSITYQRGAIGRSSEY